MKNLKLVLPAILLALSSSANAATIALDDWWLQTDSLGGLSQSSTDSSIFFAVSDSNSYNVGDTYIAPTGYHWATTAEAQSIFDLTPTYAVHTPSFETYSYYGHGGWNGYTWENLVRYYFRFADSDSTGAIMHTGGLEDRIFSYDYAGETNNFAGIVLVQDVSTVPVPAAAWLFGSALLGFFGFSRRKANA